MVSCRSKMCGGIGGDAVIGEVGLAETRIEAAKASKGNGSIAIAIVCVLRAVKNKSSKTFLALMALLRHEH